MTPSDLKPDQALTPDPLGRQAEVTLTVAKSTDGEEDKLILLFERGPADNKWRLFDLGNGGTRLGAIQMK